ncbi:MAG: FMN-binding protein [Treponema sp.]|jgi:major membrane immunogen (membrane-anchored lipoprotein)|nr:FMN-binding protein [Treponema sp.]
MIASKNTFPVLFPAALFAALFLCAACSASRDRVADGYFTAEAAEYDSHGWKEFVSLYMNNGRIITVEYNAKNASGFIKSWDMDYMRRMNAKDGTYPNRYTRTYALALLNRQHPGRIDALAGATESWHAFRLLAAAAMVQAEKGDKRTALVEIPGQKE